MSRVAPKREPRLLADEWQHHLLLIQPLALRTVRLNDGREVRAVAANVADLTEGEFRPGVVLTGPTLIENIKSAIGKGVVLGRLVRIEVKGGTARILLPHTERDLRLAEKWLAENPGLLG